MNILISIIVPVYKVEKYLKKCINSIIVQTYKNLEIILVDDGSPDNCGKICDEYAIKDKRIKVIHKDNGGLSSARNAGLDIAKGEYIFFVDSDDFIAEDAIESLYKPLISENADIAICDYVRINEVGEETENIVSPIKNEILNKEQLFQKLIEPLNSYYVVAWNKLYKRSVFNQIRYPEGKIHEDEFTIHRILFEVNKAVSISKKLYYYVQTNTSIMRSDFSIKRMDSISAYVDRCIFLFDNKIYFILNKVYLRLWDKYYDEYRCILKKNYKKLIKEYDISVFNTYKHCKSKLSKKARLYGAFPRTIIFLKKCKRKMRSALNWILHKSQK